MDTLSQPAALPKDVDWLPSGIRGELRLAEPMSRHTTWRVGGPVERFFRPADRQDLSRFLAATPACEPLHWCGFGSNLLVRDGGLRGTVICLHPGLVGIDIRQAECTLVVDAGAPCARVARLASRAGLIGAEFLAGVPGTMGGALTMNAGAHGGDTWSLVAMVETIDRGGRINQRAACQYRVGYRSVLGPADEWFVGAVLRLAPGDARAATGRLRELLVRRAASQPIGRPSCGSVFRNPPGGHAAALIESAGLKGQRLGGAEVSVKHANFIVNAGGGSASDIEALIQLVQRRVLEVHGVALEPECRIIGMANPAWYGDPTP
jgi:UDP-N-acetylmuramate dehydrogenase